MIQSTKIRIFSQVKNTFPEVKEVKTTPSPSPKSQNPDNSKNQNLIDSLSIILCAFD